MIMNKIIKDILFVVICLIIVACNLVLIPDVNVSGFRTGRFTTIGIPTLITYYLFYKWKKGSKSKDNNLKDSN